MGRRLFGGTDLRSRALPGHCSVSATWVRSANAAMPVRSEPVTGPRPNVALLFIVIHCYLRGRGRRAKRTKPCGARRIRRSVQRPHCYFIVINNAAVRELPRTTPSGTARRPPTGRARVAAPGKMLAQHPRPVRCFPLHDVKQPGPRGTVGPTDRLRKTTSNANLSSTITLRSQ